MIVLDEYCRLPVNPPPSGCYLCTAAARGHRRWVRSEELRLPGGKTMHVNDQLRCFKAFELLLLVVCPKWHRLCRRIYDAIGPKLAAAINGRPLLADLTYSALKPAEWLCRFAIFLIAQDAGGRYRRLYWR